MAPNNETYPASLSIDYPDKLDRVTTFFRILWSIPIIIIISLLSASTGDSFMHRAGQSITYEGVGVVGGLFAATALMILFRRRYPRWWFNFALELNRFSTRVGAYLLLLTDKYPSTEDTQTVH